MKPDFSTRRRARGPRPVDVVLVAGSAVLAALAGQSAWGATKILDRVRAAVQEVRRETQSDLDQARALESRKGDAREKLAAQVVWTAEAPPPRVLADLAQVMPAEVRLAACTIDYGDTVRIEMRVVARNAAAYDGFLRRLEESPLFTDVVFGGENREGEVTATVQAVYRGGHR